MDGVPLLLFEIRMQQQRRRNYYGGTLSTIGA
jgi:hypothetical protein